ncbi:MAG: hypothetical protein EBX66_05290, partial [Betaproteobacteria bacterium]|nr:hypothetical protein [Betaproteobacteria bacterium]
LPPFPMKSEITRKLVSTKNVILVDLDSFIKTINEKELLSQIEEAEKSSALALESNELGYQVGVRINIDVLNALQQLSSTRRDLSKARYDALLAGLRLKSAAGGLTSDDLRSIRAMLATERPINIPPDVAGTSFDTPVKVGQPLKPR